MTTKQKKFSDYYVETGNATQSAIKAGYSKRSARQIGNRLLSKDYISEYIRKRLSRIDSHSILNAKDILTFLSDVVKGDVTEDVVEATPDGVFTGEKHPSISDRIDASKEIMKRYEPLYKARVSKIRSEADIKGFVARTQSNTANSTNYKVDELLDAIFEDKPSKDRGSNK